MTELEILSLILGVFNIAASVCSMQFKNMKYVLALQLVSNSILIVQYIIEDARSAVGVALVAIVQLVISFLLTRRGIAFPVWLTGIFMVGYAIVTALCFTSVYDLISCAAVWCFALSIVQKSSALCRAISAVNCMLWVTYDIICAPTAIPTHAVITAFIIFGIIRLDRAEWREFFTRCFTSNDEKAEKSEE